MERTVTIDISKGGSFIYSVDLWNIGEKVQFVIKELADSNPIRGEIRWTRSWGKMMEVPGIGITFETIDKGQLEEICDKGHMF